LGAVVTQSCDRLRKEENAVKLSVIMILVVFAIVTVQASPSEQLGDKELVGALQEGGYVIFLRHPQTNLDQADTDPLNLDNTSAQRRLSDEGRKNAKALGEAFRALKIPVDQVIASKFDRATEAAKLVDLGPVTTSLDVAEGGLVVSPKENARRAQALRRLLATPPPPGKNTVIVSHRPNIQDAAGKEFGDMVEGEVAVFKPTGGDKFQLVARVAPPEKWTQWAK
jgi:phosphohistidine phosphatase SixA